MEGQMSISITDILEDVKTQMCDKYCKYPTMPVPDGKNEDWLFEEGSPCWDCPLNRL